MHDLPCYAVGNKCSQSLFVVIFVYSHLSVDVMSLLCQSVCVMASLCLLRRQSELQCQVSRCTTVIIVKCLSRNVPFHFSGRSLFSVLMLECLACEKFYCENTASAGVVKTSYAV